MALRECNCGSGEPRKEILDARGIFVTFACSKCRSTKLKAFRSEIFTDARYEADETIEPECP